MLHTCMHLFFTLPQILNICNAVGIYEQSDENLTAHLCNGSPTVRVT